MGNCFCTFAHLYSTDMIRDYPCRRDLDNCPVQVSPPSKHGRVGRNSGACIMAAKDIRNADSNDFFSSVTAATESIRFSDSGFKMA